MPTKPAEASSSYRIRTSEPSSARAGRITYWPPSGASASELRWIPAIASSLVRMWPVDQFVKAMLML